MSLPEHGFHIDFGEHGNSNLYCGAGWSAAEPLERWALGSESRLSVPAPSIPGTYFLVLKFRPLLIAGRIDGQRLSVSVNGESVGDFGTSGTAWRACCVPWQLIEGHADLQIVFHTPDAASPAAFVAGGDDRTLSVALSSLALHRDRFAPAATGTPTSGGANGASLPDAERMPLRDLMLRYESLGQNCEFGLVQRRCEVEPLGFLRFASTPLPNLLEAFEADFAGLGDAEGIVVSPSDNNTEYMVSTRYGLSYHAWVKIGEMTAEEVRRRELRRVPILIRKLLDDLRSASKIFVFRGMGALPEEEVMPLFASLRRFAANTLLFVTLADAAHPSGTVERRLPGFLVGYIERFAPSEDAHDLLLDEWITICRKAHAMRSEGVDGAFGPARLAG